MFVGVGGGRKRGPPGEVWPRAGHTPDKVRVKRIRPKVGGGVALKILFPRGPPAWLDLIISKTPPIQKKKFPDPVICGSVGTSPQLPEPVDLPLRPRRWINGLGRCSSQF